MQLSLFTIHLAAIISAVSAAPQPRSENLQHVQALYSHVNGTVKIPASLVCIGGLPYGQYACYGITNPDGSNFCTSCQIVQGNSPDGSSCVPVGEHCSLEAGGCQIDDGGKNAHCAKTD